MNLVIFLSWIPLCFCGGGGSWNYKEGDPHGPKNWQGECSGNKQSPIDIKTSGTTKKSFAAFELSDYDQVPIKTVLTNNGHTAKLSSTYSTFTPTVSGGNLPNSYKFAQVHFHWGSSGDKGSEHLVDGSAYAMEMHLVHYKSTFATIGDSLADPQSDTLAVLGIFIQESETPHSGISKLLPYFSQVSEAGSEVEIDNFPLADLIPEYTKLDDFYRYEGGLTTPGCNEIVQWTVLRNPINMTQYQLNEFRKLLNHDKEPLEDNFRPVQPTNDRNVVHATTGAPRWSSVKHPSSDARCNSFSSITMAVILVCYLISRN